MSPTIAIIKIVLLFSMLGWVVASSIFERSARHTRIYDRGFLIMGCLAVLGWYNFGQFHNNRDNTHVHVHEQFHFFLGSKYLSEIGYDSIYEAACMAAETAAPKVARCPERRDPLTFELHDEPISPERRVEIRGRFSDSRWEEFSRDVLFFLEDLHLNVPAVWRDHGNTGSPTWAAGAALFTGTIPLSKRAVILFANLDALLFIILFSTIYRFYGLRVTSITVTIGLCVPLVYDYLGGTIVRMDWIFALGMAMCFFDRRRMTAGGCFLGYAVASKLIAGIMVLPLGALIVVDTIKSHHLDRDHARFIAVSFLSMAVFAALPLLIFWDSGLWSGYLERILVTLHEKYYGYQYSFRDIFLQFAAGDFLGAIDGQPGTIMARQPDVFIGDYRWPFAVAQLALLSGVVFVSARHTHRVAFGLGFFAVYIALVTNMYYWLILLFPALALAPTYKQDKRHLYYLCALILFVSASVVQTTFSTGAWGYNGSYRLFLLLGLLIGSELLLTRRGRAIMARLGLTESSGAG